MTDWIAVPSWSRWGAFMFPRGASLLGSDAACRSVRVEVRDY